MFRLIAVLLLAILLISVIRMVAGVLLKGLAAMFMPSATPGQNANGPSPEVPVGGELRKDPVCGTYVSTATNLTKTSKGETFYFCSTECRDKFA